RFAGSMRCSSARPSIRSTNKPRTTHPAAKVETLRGVIAEMNRRLGQEVARRARIEQRLSTTSAALQKMETTLQRTMTERDALSREVESVEDHVVGMLEPATASNETPAFSGRTILYVGGRAHQIPQFKALVERTGARFLHHDGGIEHSAALRPGLVSRADHLFFPIDCISHDAVSTIKRLCRQLEKPYQPLRTASLATLVSALAQMSQERATPVAAE